ncbi:homocysteine S-methyltransferase family protein [Micromonospora sp. LOL_021]|uniref:homocysteine S-methyltransferase family protein n=1 Tax=Micromonospora sp. LOL_021 TaxID=3345417 RepID=UPI003A8505E8
MPTHRTTGRPGGARIWPESSPTLLDGGLATELHRRGVDIAAPAWTTAALLRSDGRNLLHDIHLRYARAGADVLTVNSFRCNLRCLRRLGMDDRRAARTVRGAVALADSARAAADRSGIRLAGSVAPVEDCYRPRLVPDNATLEREHRWLVDQLCSAGVDLLLIETMNTQREAVTAVRAGYDAGVEVWASFVCDDWANLLSGESLVAAATAVRHAGATTVLANCATPVATNRAVRALSAAGLPAIGGYPNLEDRSSVPAYAAAPDPMPTGTTPADYVSLVAGWMAELRPAVVGGCCGSTPEHIDALARALGRGVPSS